MARTSLLARSLVATFACALLLASAGLAWAVADDFRGRDVVPSGTEVAGIDMGGVPSEEARARIRNEIARPLLSPLLVAYRGGTATFESSSALQLDSAGMLAEALAPNRSLGLRARVVGHATGEHTGIDVPLRLTVDRQVIARWVDKLAREVFRPSRDASVTLIGTRVQVLPSATGVRLDRDRTVALVEDALERGDKTVHVPTVILQPRVSEDSIGKTIVVSIPKRRLYLYEADELEKEYAVAVGTPGFPTPEGRFEIVNKRYMPTWTNPGSDWAKDMPPFIGPGPGNPLGTRALDLDSPGIRIHGTSKDYSIGTAASHGCMRMHMWDVEDLFDRVPAGTRVFVVG